MLWPRNGLGFPIISSVIERDVRRRFSPSTVAEPGGPWFGIWSFRICLGFGIWDLNVVSFFCETNGPARWGQRALPSCRLSQRHISAAWQ
jgi:hypothetical protein